MPFQDVPNTALIELIFDEYDQTVENTLYVRTASESGIWSGLDLALVAEWTAGWWTAEIQAFVSNAVTLREVKATDLNTEFGAQSIFPVGEQGDLLSSGLPGNVTMCVSFRTALRGRNWRGRNYFVGLAESQVSGNTVAGGVLLGVATGYAQYQDYLDDSGVDCEWVVVSRQTEGITRPFGTTEPVTNVVIVDAFTDAMRGRLTGRGA